MLMVYRIYHACHKGVNFLTFMQPPSGIQNTGRATRYKAEVCR